MENGLERLRGRFSHLAAAVILFVPAVAFSLISSESFRYPKLWAGQGLILLLAAVGLMWPRYLDWGSKALAVIALAALVSLTACSHPLTGFQELGRIVSLVWAFVIFRQLARPERLWPVILAAGMINCAIALAQAGGYRPEWWVPWQGRHAVYGTFGNPNFLAEYLAPLAVVALGRYLISRDNRGRAVNCLGLGILLACLLLTVSRSSWLGLIAGTAVMVILARRQIAGALTRGKALPLLITTAVVLAALWGPLWTRITSTSFREDPGVTTRVFMWRAAASMVRDRPLLGVGPGGYGLNYLEHVAELQREGALRPAYAGITTDAHSDILQLAAERGLLGIVVWLAAFALIGRAAVRGFVADLAGARIRRAAAVGAATAIVVECAFGFPMRVMPTAVLFLWLAACASPPAGGFMGLPGWLRYVKFGLWGLPFLWLTWRTLAADAALAAGGKTGDAEARFRQGLRLLPSHGELHFRLGIDLRRQGRLKEAEEEYREALAGFKDPDVFFNLGFVNLTRGKYEEAARWYAEGLKRYPFYKARPHAEMGEALMRLGRKEEAAEAARRALEIDAGCVEARRLAAKLGL